MDLFAILTFKPHEGEASFLNSLRNYSCRFYNCSGFSHLETESHYAALAGLVLTDIAPSRLEFTAILLYQSL